MALSCHESSKLELSLQTKTTFSLRVALRALCQVNACMRACQEHLCMFDAVAKYSVNLCAMYTVVCRQKF